MSEWLILIGIAVGVMIIAIILIDVLDTDPEEGKRCSFYDPCPECQEREL